jgi:hypothetical protein
MGDIEAAIEHLHEALKLLKSGHFIECTIYHDLTAFRSYLFQRHVAVKDITDATKHHRTDLHPDVSDNLSGSNLACDLHRLFPGPEMRNISRSPLLYINLPSVL